MSIPAHMIKDTDPICLNCYYWRETKKARHPDYPPEGIGFGECMVHPPTLDYQQAAAYTRNTFVGTVHDVLQPGFVQQRPITDRKDYCSHFKSKLHCPPRP